MTRPRPGIGSELLPVALILVCLAGTWLLIVAMHRRGPVAPRPAPAAPPVPSPIAAPEPVPIAVAPTPPPPAPPPRPRPPRPIAPPPEDPTRKALARLEQAQAEQQRAAQVADRRAESLERARQAALADADRWKRREMLVKTQMDALAERAQRLDSEADALALERDVLAHELDAAKASLARARTRTSYAVLPHKGPNGTWRRPIIIECRNGTATLQPHGPTYSMVEMSGVFGMRSAPIVAAVAKEVVKAQMTTTPDGAPAVPYIFFVIRPDGIRPYYEARGRLENLGIAFGYELVEQDWEIDYPDLDNTEEWDGSPPRPVVSAPVANAVDRVWPANAPRQSGNGPGQGRPTPDSFVWPAQPRGSASGGANPDGLPELPGSLAGSGTGTGSGMRPGRPNGRGPTGGMSGNAIARNGLGAGGNGVDPSVEPFPGAGAGPGSGDGSTGGMPDGTGSSARPSGGGGTPGGPFPGGGDGSTGGMPDGADPSARPFAGGGMPGGPSGLTPIPADGLPNLDNPSGADGVGGGPGGTTGKVGQGGRSGSIGQPPRGGGATSSSIASQAAASGPGSGEFKWPSRTTVPPAANPGPLGLGPPATPRFGISGTGPATGNASEAAAGEVTTGIQGNGTGTQGQGGGSQGDGTSSASNGGGSTGGGAASAGTQGTSGAGGQTANGNASGVPIPFPLAMPGSPGAGGSDGGKTGMPGRAGSPEKPPLRIEIPFEIVVACGPDGAVIHPGGYRLSPKILKSKEGLLAKELRSVVRTRQYADPMIRPRPSIRFLVEPGGNDTYFDARRQTLLSGLDWPVTLQVGDTNVLSPLARESF